MRAIGISRLIIFYLLMATVALVAIWMQGILPAILVPKNLRLALFDGILGVGVGMFLVICSRAATSKFAWANTLAREFQSVLGPLNNREILLIAILSGVGEEILFRGLLQPALGLWIAAAVFGLLHVGPNRNFIPWTIMAFFVGILFGLLFLWTGNLIAPILAHFIVNYLNLRYLCSPGENNEIHVEPVGAERLVRF